MPLRFTISLLFTLFFCSISMAQKTISVSPLYVHGEDELPSLEYIERGEIVKLTVYDYNERRPISRSQYYSLARFKNYTQRRFNISKKINIRFAHIYGKKGWMHAIALEEPTTEELYVVFDLSKVRYLSDAKLRYLMAHELGHLVQKHYEEEETLKKSRREIEADFLSGYLLGRYDAYGRSIKRKTKKAIKQLYGNSKKRESKDYPAPRKRKELFQLGYKNSDRNLYSALRTIRYYR